MNLYPWENDALKQSLYYETLSSVGHVYSPAGEWYKFAWGKSPRRGQYFKRAAHRCDNGVLPPDRATLRRVRTGWPGHERP